MGFTRKIGALGEEYAAEYLKKKGYKEIARNFSSRFGEIDLIMLDRDQLVFVEIKTRSSNIFGTPGEAVTYQKLTKMIKTSQFFLARYSKYRNYRFDVIEILTQGTISVNHIQNVTG